jgi:DNA-binding CsgD family transcriptional regulator/ketosteroid isomerase-like protein
VSVTEDTRSRHLDVIEQWFAAFNAHDIDALCALVDPEVEFVPLDRAVTAPPGTTYHGHDGLRTLMEGSFRRFPRVRVDHGTPQLSGNRVTVAIDFVLDDGLGPPQVRAAVSHYLVADGLIRRISAEDPDRAHVPGERVRAATLSPREREVLSRLADGRTIPEIADELVLSPLTIRTHVRNAKDKLQARTTAHAVAIAVDKKVLDV